MVLASNEWLNNCDEDQKSATTATTATNNTPPTVATSTAAIATGTNVETSANCLSNPSTTTASVVTSIASVVLATNINQNANIELTSKQDAIEENAVTEDGDDEFLKPTFHDTQLTKLKAECSKHDTTPEMTVESLNNNQELDNVPFLENVNILENTKLNSNLNAMFNLSSNDNTNDNSNTSTLQSSIHPNARSSQGSVQSNPITPQALSSALQSALMHASTTTAPQSLTTTTIATTNNFLSSLGIGSVNAVLQLPTAKQLSATFLSGEKNFGNNYDSNSTSSVTNIENNGQAKIVLLCEANSHPFDTRAIHLVPNIECKVGRLIAKSKAAETNAIFDCKVLSRTHAVLWYSDDGKFWVKDTKSSNGTFINENKLGTEAAELHFGDVVKFGVDVLENTRKEVHGCIIARVKLYYPDGRETITINSNAISAELSPNSADAVVSFEDLQRLNIFMQETTQREKVLKSKLFNIQNMLDATRKNSALCWQSLIAEDQLLHRIHSLEKKLQFMEKNVPESVIRNEVLKLLDDKISYQTTAKEALRKVYQERCDAMQKLTKMEAAYTAADNECKVLRDQIMSTKQSLKDVNKRLLCLEAEYVLFKTNNESTQQEAKEQQEQRINELMDQLQQRDLECEGLRNKISELQRKRGDLLDDEEQLQIQALGKLDAAIADMDLGDDDDDDDAIESQAKVAEAVNEHVEALMKQSHTKAKGTANSELNGANVCDARTKDTNGSSSSDDSEKILVGHNPIEKPLNEAKEGIAKATTIMKWLQNSDMNKKEGSIDIFNAICNDSDSSDEMVQDASGSLPTNAIKSHKISENYTRKCKQFTSKLQSVQKNLKQLEEEIESETNVGIANVDSGFIGSDATEEEKELFKLAAKHSGEQAEVLSKRNKSYMLLKASVSILREAYNDICDNAKQIDTVKEEEEMAVNNDNSNEFFDDARFSLSLSSLSESAKTIDTDADTFRVQEQSPFPKEQQQQQQQQMENEINVYQEEIALLHNKLDQIENDSQNTLEIMQIECDAFKDKVDVMTKLIEELRNEKQTLKISDDTKPDIVTVPAPITTTTTTTTTASNADIAESAFEQIMREDLATMNSGAVQREEELIMYKERLEKIQIDNLKLIKEITDIKQKANSFQHTLLSHALPYGIAAIALFFYLVTNYF